MHAPGAHVSQIARPWSVCCTADFHVPLTSRRQLDHGVLHAADAENMPFSDGRGRAAHLVPGTTPISLPYCSHSTSLPFHLASISLPSHCRVSTVFPTPFLPPCPLIHLPSSHVLTISHLEVVHRAFSMCTLYPELGVAGVRWAPASWSVLHQSHSAGRVAAPRHCRWVALPARSGRNSAAVALHAPA